METIGDKLLVREIIWKIGNRGPDSQQFVEAKLGEASSVIEEFKADTKLEELGSNDSHIIGFSSVLHLRGAQTNNQPYRSKVSSNFMLYNGEMYSVNSVFIEKAELNYFEHE